VVISHLRQNKAISERLKAADFLYLPVIALGELLYGAYVLPFPERQMEKIKRFLEAVTILGVTHKTAEIFGQVSAELRKAGDMIPTNDIWIAALAQEHGLSLAAQDVHFDRVQTINVLQW
jgi:predicted nucleic acid-binding protein